MVCAPQALCPASPPPNAGAGGVPPPVGSIIESRIDGEFEGWTGETVFKLQNGQYWQQVSYAYRYHYAFSPAVRIVSENGRYMMHVDGVDASLAVELADVVVDSQIVSNFDGWDGDTIFELANGQVWQQSGAGVAVHVAVRPRAFIYREPATLRMQVQGIDKSVPVTQLR